MTSSSNHNVAALLSRLEPLPQNTYFTAFGTGDRCLFGSPNGYGGLDLPLKVMDRLATDSVKRIWYASFGNGPEEWFVDYEDKDGQRFYQYGDDTPPSVLAFKPQAGRYFRVQYDGTAGSYVAWTESEYHFDNIPNTLIRSLRHHSLTYDKQSQSGQFKHSGPRSITWHGDGSYFLRLAQSSSSYDDWHLPTEAINNAWKRLLGIHDNRGRPQFRMSYSLAHAAINPHAPDSYVFVKKTQQHDEVFEYVFRFPSCEPVESLADTANALQTDPRGPQGYKQARALRTGRPHPTDTRELYLTKNEKVTVINDEGRNWFIVRANGKQGYAHGTWLRFDDSSKRVGISRKEAWNRFQRDCEKLCIAARKTEFLDFSLYVDPCSQAQCKLAKEDAGVCAHELRTLFQGSGRYTRHLLMQERLRWHPDSFGRRCHPGHGPTLKKKAEGVFKLIGTLIDELAKSGE